MENGRAAWTVLDDQHLLGQCAVDTYRASGPGGQKRNKTSSAVRLRHLPSGLMVIAEESRSQHENRARALKRLRQAFFLKLRNPVPAEPETLAARPEYAAIRGTEERLHLGRKDPRYWPLVGLVLDVLEATAGRVAEAAALLKLSTGNLVDILASDPKVWEQANHTRARFGLKSLKAS